MLTADFDYRLPDRAIAQSPVEPRDEARLLNTTTGRDHVFAELPDLLEPGDLLVLNDTKVRAARLHGRKEGTGGRVEVLLLERHPDDTWEAMVRPARRLRQGSRFTAGPIHGELLTAPVEGTARIVLRTDLDIEDAIEMAGEVPLPPYITTELADRQRYQTVYASAPGSSAAPTAGLHFTDALLDRVGERGIGIATVELRVGMGTFRPMTSPRVEQHHMHREWVSVPSHTAAAVQQTRMEGRRVVAVGTTVVRALETAAREGEIRHWEGHTDLFITPGFRFAAVDRLITNFHLPRSTLVVMVAAFMGPGWRDAYQTALRRGYRFLSFGDAMMADRAEAA
ncbi:MAG: tRNA preQ1(34) S-adenosylmethionine ribosyltransferase-isomerase QueA [Actinomycetota bacterium]